MADTTIGTYTEVFSFPLYTIMLIFYIREHKGWVWWYNWGI